MIRERWKSFMGKPSAVVVLFLRRGFQSELQEYL